MTHGTEMGYHQHLRANEQPCGHCTWAHKLYNREARARQRTRKEGEAPKPLAAPCQSPVTRPPLHGTPSGLAQHALLRNPVCRLCLDAVCEREHRDARRYLTRYRGVA